MKTSLLTLLGIVAGFVATAQTQWKPTTASVSFRIKNAGLAVNGTFGGFQGQLLFDPANPEKSVLIASVDAKAVDTGIGLRNDHLRKKEYLDVASFPRVTLKSTRITAKGNGMYTGAFELSLKGVTRPVSFPFTFTNGTFDGGFIIDRRDFGVGKNSLIMGDEVTITIHVQSVPVPAVAEAK
ncbi:YceI family protein [Arsenicibacter rosenii]|uniref:Lipid/polyisoprenoid-binding YceI-like domain-containing protein n=1 Tax=Arsenicibacter rosenii TaxID=1750698 RepID=A0A1S2VH37_9BACT|nr:YceI family protein [Arsenicibacter rosenii]OIN57506.1 hypothetical protein BLX24_19980 [Arsenicibacter rosenii]